MLAWKAHLPSAEDCTASLYMYAAAISVSSFMLSCVSL